MAQFLVRISDTLPAPARTLLGALAAFTLLAGTDPSLLSWKRFAVPEETRTPYHSATGLSVLSPQDQQRYRAAFRLQQAKHYPEADAMAAQASDPILKPDLLAERYLSADYAVSENELRDWLKVNAGHPQAAALYGLAHKLSMALPAPAASHEATVTARTAINGYEKDGLRGTADGHWMAGLDAYRRQDMAQALAHFKALLNAQDTLSGQNRAAVAFWAYRAALVMGDKTEALAFAQVAAGQPPGFYSILARHSVNGGPGEAENADVQLPIVAPMLAQASVRHAIALKEAGQDPQAEQSLRAVFSAAEEDRRKSLIILARLLDLPAAQMHMALDYAQGEDAHDSLFPMPRWTPTSGYRIEPALLFAIMRQESGFNPNAHSASGAVGVMQLMPETAHAMARSERIAGRSSLQPAVSMALGQSYLEHLMDTSFIGDNLIYLTAAYNAGPGTVSNWQRTLHCNNDPLLFIESIPYEETRDYVVRVIGNYWVYSDLFGGHDTVSAETLAQGKWPRYSASRQELSAMLSRLSGSQVE